MLSVAEAQSIVLKHARALAAETVPLAAENLGLVLAEDVQSDIDMPPYDKSLMDGYAVRSSDLPEGRAILHVIEEITAGQVSRRSLGQGQAARIMTGAPIPPGADAVVIVERTKALAGDRVQIEDRPAKPGLNILARGREMRRGETILRAGTVLRPQEFGTLATVGRTVVKLFPRPQVAVLSTGDEVVEPTQEPGPGQIRNGNGAMLVAQVRRAGALPHFLGIARDRVESLRPFVAEGLRSNVLVLSGGVSAGKLDLVPGVLQELGVQAHFHKVEMKPGKPVFFGTHDATLVFGLPGNPVSALVCFELFVRPALRRLMGHTTAETRLVQLPLAREFAYATDRPTYHPARLNWNSTGPEVELVPWFGSSDLRGLGESNAFVVLPPGNQRHPAGQCFPVLLVGTE
jgi:molybdopterin molybdotransferase